MSTDTTLTKRQPTAVEKMGQRPTLAPLVDIYENVDELLILADLPGVSKEDLMVHLDRDQLTIEGRRLGTSEEDTYHYRRAFVVPRGIEPDRIEANIHDGVLKVVLPKPAALKPRQIDIKVG